VCLRVLRAWGRMGLIRLLPSGSCHLYGRTITHPPTELPASQVMGPTCADSYTDVAGSNPAACPRVSGPTSNLQVGRFESIEERFLVSVELRGVLNWMYGASPKNDRI